MNKRLIFIEYLLHARPCSKFLHALFHLIFITTLSHKHLHISDEKTSVKRLRDFPKDKYKFNEKEIKQNHIVNIE